MSFEFISCKVNIHLVLFQVLNQGTKNKFSVIGSANLNLAEYASKTDDQDSEIKIPLTVSSSAIESLPMLYVSS